MAAILAALARIPLRRAFVAGEQKLERSTRRRRHHHGQPVRLGDHAPCRRDAGRARRPARRPIVSAHRTPERLYDFAKGAKAAGFKVIIAGAGGAAHLPGMTASMTPLPVLGVPVRIEGADGAGFAALHRPDAGRHPGRHAGHRQGRRGQRRPAGRRRPGAVRRQRSPQRLDAWRAAQTAKVADRADGRRRDRAARRIDHRHPRRRPARPHAGDGRRAARLPHHRAGAAGRTARRHRSPTAQIVAAYDDAAALAELAAASDVVTYEFENVPVAAAEALAARVAVYPPARALDVAQDRVAEKTFLNGIGVATAAFRAVDADEELTPALTAFGGSGMLKTRRVGYDGKGQRVFRNMEPAASPAPARRWAMCR